MGGRREVPRLGPSVREARAVAMLFASDDDVRHAQRDAEHAAHGLAGDERRELLEDLRERRHHARFREFAFLLLVLPALMSVFALLAQWLVARFFAASPPSYP